MEAARRLEAQEARNAKRRRPVDADDEGVAGAMPDSSLAGPLGLSPPQDVGQSPDAAGPAASSVSDAPSGPVGQSGTKRRAEDQGDDSGRARRGEGHSGGDSAAQTGPPSAGVKRPAEDQGDDSARAVVWEDRDRDEDRVMAELCGVRDHMLASIIEEQGDQPVCDVPDPPTLGPCYAGEFYDDVSGKWLEPERVREARKAEIDTIDAMKVWEVIPRPPGARVIGTRWVDIDKGDRSSPCYRSRLVAQEFRSASPGGPGFEYFAAMPPLAAFRMLISLFVTERVRDVDGGVAWRRADWVLGFVDVKRAHFCSAATREIFVELPPEAAKPDGTREWVGRLLKSMYGCRDAGVNWEREVRRVLELNGFRVWG